MDESLSVHSRGVSPVDPTTTTTTAGPTAFRVSVPMDAILNTDKND